MRQITILDQWFYYEQPELEGGMPCAADGQPVRLPHVWNKEDASREGARLYTTSFHWSASAEKKMFLEFGAVAGAAKVWVNEQPIGEHRGGYACFRFEVTDALREGKNTVAVLADNTRYPDINPLMGDFNNYGGIYRTVTLIETGCAHFDLLYHGTSGLDLTVSVENGIGILTASSHTVGGDVVEYELLEGQRMIAQASAPADGSSVILKIEQPRLWDGMADPHLYTCRARLLAGGEVADEVSLPCGFRTIRMTADKGLFLNGRHIHIDGVAKHQDREGAGCAPTEAQLDEDFALIREIGANAVRLSHYQHPQYFYDLCDQNGLLVWAEIPMLSMPDGNDAVVENAKQQLTELILQNRHHPAIYCWGVQNEIAMMGESLEMYRKTGELNALVKKLDPSRLSACANLYCVKNNSQLNFITDLVGYNIYYGWYYGEMEDYSSFFQKFRTDNPQVPLGVSEYGVDCSTGYHSDAPQRKDYSEEFQALFHETVYPQIAAREDLWGSYVWNMFDFGSAIRDEGGVKGKNCKGLVSFDRKTKKDAFYYYKAQWSSEPFVYITGRRYQKRCGDQTTVKVYSNQPEVTLTVNGTVFSALRGKIVFLFEQVPLAQGDTRLTVTAGECTDEIILSRVEKPESSYIFVDPHPEINVKNWFTMGQSEDDLFPEGRFSVMDEIGDLQASREAWALLEEMTPEITADERTKKMTTMPLLRIINRMGGVYSEDLVKELNKKLSQICK